MLDHNSSPEQRDCRSNLYQNSVMKKGKRRYIKNKDFSGVNGQNIKKISDVYKRDCRVPLDGVCAESSEVFGVLAMTGCGQLSVLAQRKGLPSRHILTVSAGAAKGLRTLHIQLSLRAQKQRDCRSNLASIQLFNHRKKKDISKTRIFLV